MTKEQVSNTKKALHRCTVVKRGRFADRKAWEAALEQTLQYYDEADPVRAKLLRLRYMEHHTEERTIDELHIGRTTYQKAHRDALSTLAVFAASEGAKL